MRGASREAYGTVHSRLDVMARSASPDDLQRLGNELLRVAGLLTREPRLRRALADPARSGADRSGLLAGLLRGEVADDTVELATALVSGRWSNTTELLDGTELLGVSALLRSAERADALSEVEDELFRFGQIVDGDLELAATLGDTAAPLAGRETIIVDLLDGTAHPITTRLAKLALAGFGGRTLTGGLTRLVELCAQQREEQVAYVTVASPLSGSDEAQLRDRLRAIYHRGVSIQVTVDPSILGGARVRIGSDLYDGTVLRRLADARHAVAGN